MYKNYSVGDKFRIMKISNNKFLNINRHNNIPEEFIEKIVDVNTNRYNNDYYYYKYKKEYNNNVKFPMKNLKPTHKGFGKIIQPGGGYKGN